ncbi:hypothetical protein G6F68_012969 [Rhizopus microsporus]|nr:hypothetical protein G6F68_012969 [Rhizopus microsporus]
MPRNTLVGLVGESGSGKTTPGRALLRLFAPTAGRILFDGQDITTLNEKQMLPWRRRMQIVFQDPYASLNPRMTVAEILGEALDTHRLAQHRRSARIGELLERVGLNADHSRRYPHEFSGGQRQRELHLALLAVRQGARRAAQQAGVDGAFPGQFARLFIQRGFGRARFPESEAAARVRLHCQHQVVQHAGLLEDIGDLVGPRQPGRHALMRIHASDVAPAHGQRAGIGRQRAGQQA